jgi:hypothetical protein
MNTKLLLQLLLLAGCVSLLVAGVEAWTGKTWVLAPRGWWEGAVSFWLLIIAIRTVYPPSAK